MTSPDPMKECKGCNYEREYGEPWKYHHECGKSEMNASAPSPAGWERELYEKWKREHPDVMHTQDFTLKDSGLEGTRHEWWVRNYVETRLLPYLAHRDAELVEKVSEMKAKADPDGRFEVSDVGNEYWLGHTNALNAVISLITNRERI